MQNLREKKKSLTRESLFKTAFELFLLKGFEGTTVDEIADKAVVARRTFFRYFNSKEDVLVGWMDSIGTDLVRELEKRPLSEKPMQSLKNIIYAQAKAQLKDARSAVPLAKLIYNTPSIRILRLEKYQKWEHLFSEALINRSKQKKDRITQLRLSLIAALAVDAMVIATESWVKENCEKDYLKILNQTFEVAENLILK
jgi:AcrR family transcriptional regulator